MSTIRRLSLLCASLLFGLATSSFFAASAGASPSGLQIPDVPAAQAAAGWLANQLTPQGFDDDISPGTPDLAGTVNSVISLAAADVNLQAAQNALAYLEANSAAYIADDGSDGPGQLANLILAARALGADPTHFGGTNLVSRLLATEQTSGPNAGLFGTDAQESDFGGTLDQGLALSALKAAGVTADAASVSWLLGQQCADGGWTLEDQTDNPCTGDPGEGQGPDTNTTGSVVEGLAAQGAITATSAAGAKVLSFIASTQDTDSGWGYFPNAMDSPETSDPDSTALMIQTLVALGQAPDSATYDQGGSSPSSELLSFQIGSGTSAGAFFFPGFGSDTVGDLIATNQVVPALMGFSLPFTPSTASYWVANASGAVYSFGNTAYHGSLSGKLNAPIVDIVATPDEGGYWLVGSDGGVFSFGDAVYSGSTGALKLNEPIVGMASTPDGNGYWLVGSDGGVFAFGVAVYHGSTGSLKLNQPIVGIAATPDGGGYWLVAADGGVFSFGDAVYHGSTGSLKLNKPIVGIASSPDGGGYWLVGSDGGIFAFGDATYYGSTGALKLNEPIVGMAATTSGYWLVASDGGIFNFGRAGFVGSAVLYGQSNVVALAAANA